MEKLLADLNYPTERHKTFLQYTFTYCQNRRIGLGLLGSMAENHSNRFSDLDLMVSARAETENLRELMEQCETPVMGFCTVNPKGVLTVAYPHGLCVEIGIRKTIAAQERTRIRMLIEDGFAISETAAFVDIASLYRPDYLISGDGPRVLYKAILKYLNGKTEIAFALLDELHDSGDRQPRTDFAARWEAVFHTIAEKENLDISARDEFTWLLSRVMDGNHL